MTVSGPAWARRRGVVVVAVVVAVVVVIACVVAWARWRVADGDAAWVTQVDEFSPVAGDDALVVDHDRSRLLLATETGFAILARSDGSVLAEHTMDGPWDQTGSDVALVDGGVLVAGESVLGVLAGDGTWRWRLPGTARSLWYAGVDPARRTVVVHDSGADDIVGHDTRTGERVWSIDRPIAPDLETSPIGEPVAAVLGVDLLEPERRGLAFGTADGAQHYERAGNGWIGIGAEAAVAVEDGCDMTVVRADGPVDVDWPHAGPPDWCDAVAGRGRFAFVESRARTWSLDLTSGEIRELPVDDRFEEQLRQQAGVAQAHRWLVLGLPGGLEVYDAATGEVRWTHEWRGGGEILAVGVDGVVVRDRPGPWDRFVGGAVGGAVMLHDESGARAGTFFLGGAGVNGARVLGAGEAVVVTDDGDVVMLR
ncbi:hypothetical protein [Georgenia alba]|uniref:PQQ-binding-like beta-propeller repeat protein n=1 Tax=Georgenia alba TaxID=2233858 RepID=A0ABW2Q824_9MICO